MTSLYHISNFVIHHFISFITRGSHLLIIQHHFYTCLFVAVVRLNTLLSSLKMKFKNTISIIALLLFTSSAAPHDKRPTFTGATLYAYGQDISGLPVLFGDADGMSSFNG